MTQATWPGAEVSGRPQVDLWRLAIFAACVFIMLIFSEGWVFPLRGDAGSKTFDSLIRLAYLPAYGAALVLLALTPLSAVSAVIRTPFLIMLMVVVGLSVLWSTAPDLTVRRVVAVYATTLAGVVMASRFRWSELAEVFATAFAILTVAAFLMALAVPSIGVMHELFPGAWRGLWADKNAHGGIMTLGFAVLAAAAMLNPDRAKIWWPFAALAVLLVVMSTSKTSLVSVMMAVAGLMFVALVRRGPAIGVATSWLAVLALVMVMSVAIFASDVLFKALGKDATLTGRTEVWAAAIHQIEKRPWTGYGYGAVWDDTSRWGPLPKIVKEAGWKPHHSHNSWIEQWLSIGVFGLAAWALCFLQTFVLAVVAVFRDKGAYLALPFLIVYGVTSLTESVAVLYNDFRWVIFVALAVKLCWPDREVRT
ncbi:MAG: O-antigen ligase [Phenylobacterium sp.]|uniref:O-antigen ligase family protein n=1 Tax=Phenylobacterium ferrooxidans TaxID=2982689 RepID=A0ABW6CPT9_9CAUL|nr:O-antigen ligase [Phenylobacterium sp.]